MDGCVSGFRQLERVGWVMWEIHSLVYCKLFLKESCKEYCCSGRGFCRHVWSLNWLIFLVFSSTSPFRACLKPGEAICSTNPQLTLLLQALKSCRPGSIVHICMLIVVANFVTFFILKGYYSWKGCYYLSAVCNDVSYLRWIYSWANWNDFICCLKVKLIRSKLQSAESLLLR